MKTMKKVMLTIMMVMISTLVIANERPTVKVKSVEAKTVAVVAYGLGEVQTAIQLKNGNGEVLYTATVKPGESFAKKLKLAAVPSGDYTIEVENSESFTAIPVTLSAGSVDVKTADQITIMKPRLSVVGDKLNVMISDEFTKEVWVSIFDNKANRLAYERVSLDNLKRFDLSNLKEGEYTVRMSAEGKSFIQSLSLEK